MSEVDPILVIGYTFCMILFLLMTFNRSPLKNIEVTSAESVSGQSVDGVEDLHPGKLDNTPIVINPDEERLVDYRQLIIHYHWVPDKPMICLMPGQSVGYVVSQIASGKSAEEQKSLAWAIAAEAGPNYKWTEGAYLSIPRELVEGLELPRGLEAIGVLPKGACPEDIRLTVESFGIASKVNFDRFRWLYPDSNVRLKKGQTFARTMQPGQIVFIPGTPGMIE